MLNKSHPAPGHIVKEYVQGKTKIQIYDDFCVKRPEEEKQLLASIQKIALSIWTDDIK